MILVVVPTCEMPAEPSTTAPPVGPAKAARGKAIKAAMAVMVASEVAPGKSSRSAAGTALARLMLCRFVRRYFSWQFFLRIAGNSLKGRPGRAKLYRIGYDIFQ